MKATGLKGGGAGIKAVPTGCFRRGVVHTRAEGFAGEGIDVVGSAFAGRDRIERVEISFDAGESWQDCEITYPSQENAWTLWRYRWNPPATGPYTLMVRATDEHGNRQQDQEQGDTDLDGLQGIHRVRLFVN